MLERLLALMLIAGCGSSAQSSSREPGQVRREATPADARLEAVEPRSSAERITATVAMLAETIGERNLGNRPEALERAATWLAAELGRHGEVAEQSYQVGGNTVRNLELVLPGRAPDAGVIVIGAHYDSAIGTPGADDNASGVAALLELARLIAVMPRAREVRLVAFVNEEPPYFQSGDMGSLVYAKRLQSDGVKVAAMLSLESMGFYSDAAESQKYPPPLSALYPDVGNFIAVVGNTESAALVDAVHEAFAAASPFPVQKGSFPGVLPGVGWSDHWSFWQIGAPAIMVTDTAPFRNPHYHEPTDEVGVVDNHRLAQVTNGLAIAIRTLANP